MEIETLRTFALIAAAGCFAMFFVLDRLVGRGATMAFDTRGIKSLRIAETGAPRIGMAWVGPMRLLTQLGGPVLRYAIALPCCCLLYHWHLPRTALCVVLALGSGWIVDAIVKKVFKRRRPTVVPHLAQAGGPSFPSGHTLNAALVYSALAIAFGYACGLDIIPGALTAALVLSVAVGFSRVWLGVHWPTDVTAGWLLGTGWWLAAFGLGSAMLGR